MEFHLNREANFLLSEVLYRLQARWSRSGGMCGITPKVHESLAIDVCRVAERLAVYRKNTRFWKEAFQELKEINDELTP